MSTVNYIRVTEDEGEMPIEIPVESDGTVLLTTLNGVYPKACGLKYLATDSDCYRGVRLENGRLYAPSEGWSNTYVCVFPKSDKKRKVDEDADSLSAKSKKLEGRKCTDLIVLNLAWKTDETALRDYFSRYGDLAMVQVKRHPGTQQSKGYGFIRFSDYESQPMCLAERHYIDGRWCDVRFPMSKMEGDKQEVSRKVHVGGISERISADMLRHYFSQFGQVLDVFLPKPFRSFAFVTFEDAETATGLLGKELLIDGCHVTIGSAVPKLTPQTNRYTGLMQQQMPGASQPNPWGWTYPSMHDHGGFRAHNPNMRAPNGPMQGYQLGMNIGTPNHRHAGPLFQQQQYGRPYQLPGGRVNM